MNDFKQKLAALNFSESQKKLFKILGIVLAVFILFILVVSLVKGCSPKKISYKQLENVLIRAAKTYVEKDDVIDHEKIYGSTYIDSTTLTEKGYMKDLTKYLGKDTTCKASVLVYMNMDEYAYIPKIDCGEEYKNISLSDTIIKDNVVEAGAGLYENLERYVFRGEYVDNYVKFSGQLWRIIDIDHEGNLRMVQVDSNKQSVWDDRYNSDYKASTGLNDYEGIEPSRIKDSINALYNNEDVFTKEARKIIVPREYCSGKRSLNDDSFDSSSECSETADLMGVGLVNVSDFLYASLDENCLSRTSKECSNYNYMAKLGNTFWTMTSVADNSKDVYYITSRVVIAEAKTRNLIRLVVTINGNINFNGGTGTKVDPYIAQ